VDRDAGLLGDLADRPEVLDIHDGSPGVPARVLQADEVDDLDVVRLVGLEGGPDLVRTDPPAAVAVEGPVRDPGQHRRAHHLRRGDVRQRFGNHEVARA
jgi:hypothetical protein